MGHFQGFSVSLLLLTTLAFPLFAQDAPPAPDSTVKQRVPPPPENATAQELEHQGDLLRGEKDFMNSVDYYRAACKKQDSAVLHNKTGISFSQLHRESDARREYERAIKLDHNYAEAINNLGALFYASQRYGSAVREYKRAIRLSQDNATFHKNLGAAYFAEKDFSGAMKEYTRAMELDPAIFDRQPSGGVAVVPVSSLDRGHLHYLMAQMYGSQNDFEHCRYYLNKANEEGYPIRDALRDNEFAGLRKDPNFVTFVRSLKPPSLNSNE
jgi:tetratricopeptide (TPR) repeat protein